MAVEKGGGRGEASTVEEEEERMQNVWWGSRAEGEEMEVMGEEGM